MKKIIGLLIAASILVPVFASALSIADLQAQIQSLLSRINELRTQIQVQQGVQGSSQPNSIGVMPVQSRPRFCDLWRRSLQAGVSGDDVSALQEFLASEGVFNRAATGYYGSVTAQAVGTWQAREGIVSSAAQGGVFGPRSYEYFVRRCGGGTSSSIFRATPQKGAAPLSVTFYTNVGGLRPFSTRYEIDFGDGIRTAAPECSAPADRCVTPGQVSHVYSTNGTYKAVLSRISDPCDGNPLCMAPVSMEVLGTLEIVVGGPVGCTMEYAPVCGAKTIYCITTPCNPIPTTYGNRCAMNADGASYLYEGECRTVGANPADDPQCKRWNDGYYCGATCYRDTVGGPYSCVSPMCAAGTPTGIQGPARCLEYFSSSNRAPSISSFSGPTTLRVNETGTWTIRASDPENGTLSHSITWGDEVYSAAPQAGSSLDRAVSQTTTFTHSYSRAGTFTVTMVVRDASGQEVRTTTTVRVEGSSAGCYTGGVLVPEWTRRSCINQGGVDSCLSDAAYICRNGSWSIDSTNPPVACTMDAMMCPDGTYVGRTGPNCEFVCPSTGSCATDVAQSQQAATGQICGQGAPRLRCPYDSQYVIFGSNTCSTSYLQSRGWTVVN